MRRQFRRNTGAVCRRGRSCPGKTERSTHRRWCSDLPDAASTYCTDTRPTESIVAAAEGSDLFICEGMYAEPEKLVKAKQYKHMTFYEAADMAKRAGVREMWLTHYSPSLVHAENYLPQVREIFPDAFLGKDGKSVELMFEDEN